MRKKLGQLLSDIWTPLRKAILGKSVWHLILNVFSTIVRKYWNSTLNGRYTKPLAQPYTCVLIRNGKITGQVRFVMLVRSNHLAPSAPLFAQLNILDIFKVNSLYIVKFMFSYHQRLLPSPLLQSTQVTREQYFQEWNEHSNFSL